MPTSSFFEDRRDAHHRRGYKKNVYVRVQVERRQSLWGSERAAPSAVKIRLAIIILRSVSLVWSARVLIFRILRQKTANIIST